jgi:hypothetical protein
MRSTSHSKTRTDLLGLRLEEEKEEKQQLDSDTKHKGSLFDTFSSAKSLLSKFIHHHGDSNKEIAAIPVISTTVPSSSISDIEATTDTSTAMQFSSPVSSSGGDGGCFADEEDEDECGGSSLAEQSFSPTSFYNSTAAVAAVTSPPRCVAESKQLFDLFAMNMHRIDKDVVRCDRSYWFFSKQENLDKLKNIVYT